MSDPIDRAELEGRLLALGSTRLISAVIDGLAAAGGEDEWDSETIELVLAPFRQIVKAVGMPWVGSTAGGIDELNAWRRMDGTPLLCETCGYAEGCYCEGEGE